MNKFVAVVKRLFVQNWKMKLIALIFAFVLWSFVIAEENPTKTKIFRDIPVTYTAADELKQKGLTSSKPLTEILSAVTVTAEAPANALEYLNENMIQVSVDLSKIDSAGTYTLQLKRTTTLSQSRIVSIEPSTVTIDVEEIVTRSVPIDVQLTGEQEGFYYGEPVLESSTIDVIGARSNVDSVAKAICKIDVEQMTEPTTASYNVEYVANNGDPIASNNFTGSSSIIVELPVYPQKEVPIDLETVRNTTSGLAEGYEITNVTVEPQNVNIAGKLEDIELLESATLEPIVLDNAAGDTIVEANVKLPEGVIATVPAKVQVQFTITQPELSQTYSAMRIEAKNLEDDNLEVAITPSAVDVTVYGTQGALDSFSASMLNPFVDLTGLGKGIHQNVPVKFENEPDLGVRPVSSSATVTVTIS
ncbi:CdaR family protein [Christensenella tenuis]|uniref:YbbR-like protein n=1 Tax=Christensenella tenuis TaxID=2763033 RepID=A0ABR7EE74_9FIRM|nr:CdaR family protein [Christensenella tenuis]MBC5648092.1 hypothetical protein [Christensenella tenuis]